ALVAGGGRALVATGSLAGLALVAGGGRAPVATGRRRGRLGARLHAGVGGQGRARGRAPLGVDADVATPVLEGHAGRGAHGRVVHLEVLGAAEAEHAGDDARREGLHLGVHVPHVRVVEAAPGGDPVLGVGQLV